MIDRAVERKHQAHVWSLSHLARISHKKNSLVCSALLIAVVWSLWEREKDKLHPSNYIFVIENSCETMSSWLNLVLCLLIRRQLASRSYWAWVWEDRLKTAFIDVPCMYDSADWSIHAGCCEDYDLMRRIASVVGNEGKKQTIQNFSPALAAVSTSGLQSHSLICDTQLSAVKSISQSSFRTILGQQSSPALNVRPIQSHVGSQLQTFNFASTASGSSELKENIMVVPLPKLSPHMSNGKISKWLKKPGDEIAMYDVIFEVDTENLSEDAYKVGDFAGTVTMLVEVSLLLRLNTTHQSEWHST